MPAVELVDPVGYPAVWTFVGIALLVAVVAWFFWVFWSTRNRGQDKAPTRRTPKARPASTMPGTTDPWAAVRTIYLEKLRDLESRHARGQVDDRAVHLEIRRIMRDYTKARTGIDAATFTAADAARVSLTGPLAKTLKNLSYPSFARASTAKAQRSIGQAQDVVRQW